MIKLFVTDLDGCLSTPFETPDWDLITGIRELNKQSKNRAHIPPITICTGRPRPYAEAVAQWLDITVPIIFESAGLYYPGENRTKFTDDFDRRAEEHVREIKSWITSEIMPDYPGTELEFSKIMDAGLIHTDTNIIEEIVPKIRKFIAAEYPGFEVHKTDVSVNTVLKANNKKRGMLLLCDEFGIEPAEVAYIGDSSGDIPALEVVGHPFAPDNAHGDVKKVDGISVLDCSVTEAVFEVYKRVIEHNRAEIPQPQEP